MRHGKASSKQRRTVCHTSEHILCASSEHILCAQNRCSPRVAEATSSSPQKGGERDPRVRTGVELGREPGSNAGRGRTSPVPCVGPLGHSRLPHNKIFLGPLRRVAEMKVAHACVLLFACAHSGECGRLVVKLLALYYYFASPFSRTSSLLPTAALAGRTTLAAEKQQVAFPPPPAVVPTPPLVSPPPPGSSPAAAFTTPGVRWRWCVPCTALLTLHLYQLTICLAPAARVWRQRCGLRGRQRRRGPADCDLQCHHRCLWPRQPW